MSFLLEQNMKLEVWHAIIHLMIISKQQHYYQLIAGDIIFLLKEPLLNVFLMSEPPIETERQTRRWMRKENLYFNSRCCSPQGSGNLKSLSNYFGLSMMSSSGPHKIALLVGSLHLAITGQWLPHTTRPSFQSRILKGWKHCSRLLFISLTQKQYL